MRKVFVRHAQIVADANPVVPASKIAEARAAVAGAPDERVKHKELARGPLLEDLAELVELSGEGEDARDPLDLDVIVSRADLAARRGDREASLRILGGALSASALPASDAFTIADAVARSYDRLGKPEGCAFHVTAAELRPGDAGAVARAISCERAGGRGPAAERWFVGLKGPQRTAVDAALAKVDPGKPEGAFGDVVVQASWSGGADVDVVLLDPGGRRAGAVTRMKGARVEGATARDRETVALSSGEAGAFVVEMVRASDGTVPVSGTVTIKAFGQAQSIPFTLTGARTRVGRVDVRWESELVPLEDAGFGPQGPAAFDRAAAASALAAVTLRPCSASGQVGTGHVTVTFQPTGRVSDVAVDDPAFSGTPAGRCVQSAFFGASVSPFLGAPVRVGKTFTLR